MPSIFATILTGNRADLFDRTITSSRPVLEGWCGGVCAVVWSGENDVATGDVLRRRGGSVITSIALRPGLASGPATSACAELFLESSADLWLHLEDDWELISDPGDGWLDAACQIASNPAIGQVRLREVEHLGKPVPIQEGDELLFAFDGSGCSNRNWCNGELVKWSTNEGWPFMVGPAHFTQNPSLMHRRFAEQVYFAATLNERHAMDRFHAARTERGERPLTAQMRPGAYRHIGEGRHVGKH